MEMHSREGQYHLHKVKRLLDQSDPSVLEICSGKLMTKIEHQKIHRQHFEEVKHLVSKWLPREMNRISS